MKDEFQERFSAAKSARAGRVEEDGFEVYKFCRNGREDEWLGFRGKNREPEEIFTTAAATASEDFTGELFHTLTPENADWVAYEAGVAIKEEDVSAVEDEIKKREQNIAKAIKASNYYDEGPVAFQDADFGNVAMWIDRYHLSAPITCEAVPISELYLRLGPLGIDDRFRKKKYAYADLPALLPNAKFPKDIQDKIKGGKGNAEVIWGFWMEFDDPGNITWKRAIRVDKKDVGLDESGLEAGAVQLIVGRFNATPNSPWGVGPARRMLSDIRVLDVLVQMNIESMDHTLDPAFVYAHDGLLDLSGGIEAGVGYPAMPGSTDSIREIMGGNLDYGFFSQERQEEKVKDGFYREITQKGKTPPSASQYMGEEQKQIRRMARPAGKLWKEFGIGLLKRFEWLETQPGGSMSGEDRILVDGKTVTLRPVSPLERAQAREEVVTAQGIVGMAQEFFGPEQAALMVDGAATLTNMQEKLNDTLVRFRSEEEILQMMQAQNGQQAQGEPPQ